VHQIDLPAFQDARGSFIKTFHGPSLAAAGLPFALQESYFSISGKDVIRGMHFQLPPHDHAKIVFCPVGAILDVVLDLRKGSGTYGQFCSVELSAENHRALYIPSGFAHGFKALTEGAMTHYLVSSAHSPTHDAGIRYDSFGMDWQCGAPVMSARDQGFQALAEFDSPF
jgi:dTDP-4-dehydrorhamnose 3,5-epimerase/CDP-3, 6-dideoxy-D-glycero-D-glycero-4-hexulose-5-epimerase